MLEQKNLRVKKCGKNYIAEAEVLDTEDGKPYYVVTQLGDLLYATFNSSYLDYMSDKTSVIPKKLEGEDYWWYDSENTKFERFYGLTYELARKREEKDHLGRKYSHLKKPVGNIRYEILEKRDHAVFSCGPLGSVYELKVHLLDDDSILYVFSDDVECGIYCLSKVSVLDAMEKDETVDLLEEINGFSKTKKSKYYDLYLEMEKYRDGYEG